MSKLYITEFMGLSQSVQGDSNDTFAEPAITTQKIDTAATTGAINVLGAITGGSGYTNGVYPATPLTGGTGSGAQATITVAGGAVTVVTLTKAGNGYTAADSLSASTAIIGGGTLFAIPVTSITIVTAPFNANTRYIEIESDGIASFLIGQFPVVAAQTNNRINANERIQRGVPPQSVVGGAVANPWYLSAITNT